MANKPHNGTHRIGLLGGFNHSPRVRTPRPAKPASKPKPADARGALSQMHTNRLPENMTSEAFEKLGA